MTSPGQRDRSPRRRPRAARDAPTHVIAVALLGVLGCASDGVGGGPFPTDTAAREAPTHVIAVALLGVLGCASDGVGGGPLPTDAAARAAEIARLEARVERDRASLADMVTSERDLDTEPFHEDPELRAIADRLSADTERLERLRAMTETGADAG